MKILKIFILTLLSINLFASSAPAQTKSKKVTKKPKAATKKNTTKPAPAKQPAADEARREDYKIIIQGDQSRIDEPFLFVARDAKTYAHLQTLVENLPDSSTVDFTKEAVVAAFAGTKPTPGWEVLIRKLSDRILIDLSAPRKDRMYAQVLTTPFKVAVVPVEAEMPLAPLEATPTWTNKMAAYRVQKGTFTYSGGFAPRQRLFNVEGTIGVFTYGDAATLVFDLMNKGDKTMKLSEIASGTIREGKIELPRLDAGTFSEGPKPPVNVYGTLDADGGKLALRFEPNPTNVADGFQARGTIEASKIK
jgi:hypothetical protein